MLLQMAAKRQSLCWVEIQTLENGCVDLLPHYATCQNKKWEPLLGLGIRGTERWGDRLRHRKTLLAGNVFLVERVHDYFFRLLPWSLCSSYLWCGGDYYKQCLNKKYLFFTLKWSVKVNQHYQRDIKVSQHECGSESGGPPGCLQYYTATSGKIASFNYPTTSTSVSSTGAYFNSFLPISKIIVSFYDFQQLICQTNYMTFVSEEHQVIWNLTFLESNTNV